MVPQSVRRRHADLRRPRRARSRRFHLAGAYRRPRSISLGFRKRGRYRYVRHFQTWRCASLQSFSSNTFSGLLFQVVGSSHPIRMAPHFGVATRQRNHHSTGRRSHQSGSLAGSAIRTEFGHGSLRRRPAIESSAAARRAQTVQLARRRPAGHGQWRSFRQVNGGR